jgi:HK97 family phage portal protein
MVDRVPVSSALVDDYYSLAGGQAKHTPIELDEFYIWLRKMPEVAGVIGAVCNDLMGDGFEFRGTKAGVKAAQEFVKRNHFNKKFYSVLQDLALLGDAYLGIRVIESYYINKLLEKNKDSFTKLFDDYDSVINKLKIRSPETFYPREVFPLKSSTIRADFDEHGVIKQYIQKVKGNVKEVSFSPSEVVHFSLNNIGNDVYGSSPFNSCLNDVATLWYAKDYAGTFFQNDGTPDRMFILKDTAPGSEEFEKFKKTISKFRDAKNKHKSLVMTGEVEVKDINGFNKDLEFANLIDKFTQRLMMAWNMPVSRLSDVGGKSTSNRDAVAGYYKNINRIQMEIEETFNSELWSRFGDVEMVFKKAYKRDESVEADIVAKLVGKPVLTQNEGREYLGHKAINDKEYDVIPDSFSGNPGGQMPDTKEGEEVGNQYRPAEKMVKRGSVIKVKEFYEFKRIVEADNRTFMTAKVFVEESELGYTFWFADSVAMYECFVSKESIGDEKEFRLLYYDYSMKGSLKSNELHILM